MSVKSLLENGRENSCSGAGFANAKAPTPNTREKRPNKMLMAFLEKDCRRSENRFPDDPVLRHGTEHRTAAVVAHDEVFVRAELNGIEPPEQRLDLVTLNERL